MASNNVPTCFKKELKPLVKSSRTKKSCEIHIPYLKGHQKKNMVNEPRKR